MYGSVTDSDVIGENFLLQNCSFKILPVAYRILSITIHNIVEFSGIEEPKPESLGRNLFVESSEPFKIVRKNGRSLIIQFHYLPIPDTIAKLGGKKGGALVLDSTLYRSLSIQQI